MDLTWEQQVEIAERRNAAKLLLQKTDFVVIKATEAGQTMCAEWLAWREQLRRVARDEATEISDEPARNRGKENLFAVVPELIEIPRFLAPDPIEDVPASLLDLAEPGETAAEMQARLWSLWLELNGKLMLGLATTDETALHSRLHNDLHWFAPALEGEL